jgi:hypothetical protein
MKRWQRNSEMADPQMMIEDSSQDTQHWQRLLKLVSTGVSNLGAVEPQVRYVNHVRVRAAIHDACLKDVGKMIDADSIDQPTWPPELSTGIGKAVLPLPIVQDAPIGSFDRLHRIALDVRSVDDPTEPRAYKQNQQNERA